MLQFELGSTAPILNKSNRNLRSDFNKDAKDSKFHRIKFVSKIELRNCQKIMITPRKTLSNSNTI